MRDYDCVAVIWSLKSSYLQLHQSFVANLTWYHEDNSSYSMQLVSADTIVLKGGMRKKIGSNFDVVWGVDLINLKTRSELAAVEMSTLIP
jgi:hypothetical protein